MLYFPHFHKDKLKKICVWSFPALLCYFTVRFFNNWCFLNSAQKIECNGIQSSGYLEMCTDGCNYYFIPREVHPLSIRPKDNVNECNLTIESDYPLQARSGVLFNFPEGSCGDECGKNKFVLLEGKYNYI